MFSSVAEKNKLARKRYVFITESSDGLALCSARDSPGKNYEEHGADTRVKKIGQINSKSWNVRYHFSCSSGIKVNSKI